MRQSPSIHYNKRTSLVLLDRDGVINHDSKDYIKTASEWTPIDGSISAIVKLQIQGIDVAVCTNQSGLARGLIRKTDLMAIHNICNQEIINLGGKPIKIFFCPHLPSDCCSCRKPQPGLLQAAMSSFNKTNRETLFVGDSISDWQAAKTCQMSFALVSTGNGERTLDELNTEGSYNIEYHANLAAYVDAIN